MRIRLLLIGLCASLFLSTFAQTIQMTEMASLEQVYDEKQESESLLPMNELGLDAGGYVLYEAEVEAGGESMELSAENVRDYAAVYIDGKLVGGMTDERKVLKFPVVPGKHRLQLYVENIGRITYGPEILDNSKGLFGVFAADGQEIDNWSMIPLMVRDCEVDGLNFSPVTPTELPCFYRGTFTLDKLRDIYLDVSGWGMGEVWINGSFAGTYWEAEAQQSVQVTADLLREGENKVVVFELKNNGKRTLAVSDKAVFK